jgi:hypothetical protein
MLPTTTLSSLALYDISGCDQGCLFVHGKAASGNKICCSRLHDIAIISIKMQRILLRPRLEYEGPSWSHAKRECAHVHLDALLRLVERDLVSTQQIGYDNFCLYTRTLGMIDAKYTEDTESPETARKRPGQACLPIPNCR